MKSILTLAIGAALMAAIAACTSGDVNEPVPLETATAESTAPSATTPMATTTPTPQAEDGTPTPTGPTPSATSTASAGAAGGAGASATAVSGDGEMRVGGMLEAMLPQGTEDVVRSIEFNLSEGTLALRTVLTSRTLAEQMCAFVSGRVLLFTHEVDIQDASGNSLAHCTFDEVTDMDVDLATGSVTISTTWSDDDRAAAEDLCAAITETFMTGANVTVNAEDGAELVRCAS